MNAIILFLVVLLVLGFVARFTKWHQAWDVVVFVILLLALLERIAR